MLSTTVRDNGAHIRDAGPEQWATITPIDGEVCVALESDGDYMSWYGTPKRARKLALAILRAADAAEVQS